MNEVVFENNREDEFDALHKRLEAAFSVEKLIEKTGTRGFTKYTGSYRMNESNMNKELERLAVEKSFTANFGKYRDIDVTTFKLQTVFMDILRAPKAEVRIPEIIKKSNTDEIIHTVFGSVKLKHSVTEFTETPKENAFEECVSYNSMSKIDKEESEWEE